MIVHATPSRRALWRRTLGATALFVAALFCASQAVGQGAAGFSGESLGIVGPKGCDPGERRLRLAHGAPAEGHPIGEAAARLALEANRRFDGRLCIEVFSDGEIASKQKLVDAALRGEIEMAVPHVSAFDRFTRSFEIFEMPFLFEDPQAAEWFQNSGPGQRMLREFGGKGLKALAFWNAGMRHVAATRPVLSPPDGKGLRVRVTKNAIMPAMLKAAGAIPTKAPDDRLMEMLRTKQLTALADSWAMIYTGGVYKHLPELTDSAHNIVTYLLVISEKAWDDMPRRDRLELKRLVVAQTAIANEESRKIAARNREALLRAGASIRKLTKAQREVWLMGARQAWSRFGPAIGQDYVDAALAAKR